MKAVKKIESIGRNTWLAGVGVYNQGLRSTTDKFDQLYVDGNALIQELIHKGESVESELQGKLRGKIMLDDKISALKAKLGFSKESKDVQLDKLSAKVDDLIEVVAKLAQQKAEEKAAKPAAKTAAKPAAKAATKKAADKPAAKKAEEKATQSAAKPAATKKAPAKPRARRTTATKTTTKSTASRSTKTAAKKED